MDAIPAVLRELLRVPGAAYCCAVEQDTGRVLGEAGRDGGDPASVLPWGRSAAEFLAVAGDDLDDVMLTSRRAYHLVRRLGGHLPRPLLVYLCLDRSRANLALARRELALVTIHDTTGPPADRQVGDVRRGQVDGPAVLPRRVPARVPGPPPPAAMPAGARAMQVSLVPAPRAGASLVARPLRETGMSGPASDGRGADVAPRWADDVGTMRRVLAGLRSWG